MEKKPYVKPEIKKHGMFFGKGDVFSIGNGAFMVKKKEMERRNE